MSRLRKLEVTGDLPLEPQQPQQQTTDDVHSMRAFITRQEKSILGRSPRSFAVSLFDYDDIPPMSSRYNSSVAANLVSKLMKGYVSGPPKYIPLEERWSYLENNKEKLVEVVIKNLKETNPDFTLVGHSENIGLKEFFLNPEYPVWEKEHKARTEKTKRVLKLLLSAVEKAELEVLSGNSKDPIALYKSIKETDWIKMEEQQNG